MDISEVDIDAQTPDERLALIERLWDSLDPRDAGLTRAQEAELQRRIEDLEQNPDDSISWEEALRSIRERER
jgi:putative addiction module component (TIGR02574 family)